MQRVNLWAFYSWGQTIQPVHWLSEEDTRLSRLIGTLQPVLWIVRAMLAIDAPALPPSARDSGENLLRLLRRFVSESVVGVPSGDLDIILTANDINAIKATCSRFEASLSVDLPFVEVFSVREKGLYSTSRLIDNAELMFTDERLRAFLPEQARKDVQQGGRCLAFELPTASGFHVLRATESVVKRYYEALAKQAWPHHQRDWGRYIAELENVGAAKKVLNLLRHIKDNYRNPLMHPEDNLDIHEATNLLGITQSAIGTMLQELSATAEVLSNG